MKPFRYLVPVTLLGLAEADLSGCGRSLTFQHTNLFQFGQIQFSFSACTYDSTIGGYRAGVANFNTVDGSAWNVVKAYHAATDGSDELSPYDSWLQDPTQFSGSSRSSGFCSAWKKAANNPDFLTAQATVFSSKYLKPTQSAIDKQGLSLGISEALMYDTAITNGVGSSQGSLGWLIANTNKQVLTDISGHSGNTLTVNGFDVDEIAWVQLFLTQRSAYSSATATAASTKSFRYMVTNILAAIGDIPMLTVNGTDFEAMTNNNNARFGIIVGGGGNSTLGKEALKWGSAVTALDKSGSTKRLSCSSNYLNTPVSGFPGSSAPPVVPSVPGDPDTPVNPGKPSKPLPPCTGGTSNNLGTSGSRSNSDVIGIVAAPGGSGSSGSSGNRDSSSGGSGDWWNRDPSNPSNPSNPSDPPTCAAPPFAATSLLVGLLALAFAV